MNLNRITAGRKKEGGYVRTYIPRHLVSPSGHSSFGLSCTHNAFLPRSEEEKNRLRFLRSPLCFLSLRVPPLLLHHGRYTRNSASECQQF